MAKNNANLKAICIALRLRTPQDVRTILDLAGHPVSQSTAAGWTVGEDHKNFRPMSDAEFSAFCQGLIRYCRGPADEQ